MVLEFGDWVLFIPLGLSAFGIVSSTQSNLINNPKWNFTAFCLEPPRKAGQRNGCQFPGEPTLWKASGPGGCCQGSEGEQPLQGLLKKG